ncbi:MAG: hypothetical protein GXO21_07200 [Aquificae bacterium]|nr:hypothetical protein [Aquificota bacterium]
MIKVVLKLLFKPGEYWEEYLSLENSGWKYLIKYGLTLALIGPVLSFFSLKLQEGYSDIDALVYSVTTYFMDIATVIVFSFITSRFLKVDFSLLMKIYVGVNFPIWLSDIVDIYQPLRFLSNIGLLYSFYILWSGLGFIKQKDKFIWTALIHLVLYVSNATISELIATSPLVKKVLQNFN